MGWVDLNFRFWTTRAGWRNSRVGYLEKRTRPRLWILGLPHQNYVREHEDPWRSKTQLKSLLLWCFRYSKKKYCILQICLKRLPVQVQVLYDKIKCWTSTDWMFVTSLNLGASRGECLKRQYQIVLGSTLRQLRRAQRPKRSDYFVDNDDCEVSSRGLRRSGDATAAVAAVFIGSREALLPAQYTTSTTTTLNEWEISNGVEWQDTGKKFMEQHSWALGWPQCGTVVKILNPRDPNPSAWGPRPLGTHVKTRASTPWRRTRRQRRPPQPKIQCRSPCPRQRRQRR